MSEGWVPRDEDEILAAARAFPAETLVVRWRVGNNPETVLGMLSATGVVSKADGLIRIAELFEVAAEQLRREAIRIRASE
jgi:hypothetical protein